MQALVRPSLLTFVGVLAACSPDEPGDVASSRLWLHAVRGDETVQLALHPDEPVRLGTEVLHLVEVRPWRGLLNQRTGVALLHFAVRPDGSEWVDDLVLKSGDHVILDGDMRVEFYWSDARLHETGRWGVRDGELTTWSESFAPGTGFERTDGTIVTLVEKTETGVLRVRVEGNGDTREMLVEPGTEQEGIVYLSPPSAEIVVQVFSEQSGAATVAVTTGGSRSESIARSGELVPFDNVEMRLYDVQPESVYVSADASPWLEAVFRRENQSDRVVRVRVGAVERLGDWRLRVSQHAED